MKHVTLRLSDSQDYTNIFDLKFKLLDNHFVTKWIERVLEAQQKQYPISEPWAIYKEQSKQVNGRSQLRGRVV